MTTVDTRNFIGVKFEDSTLVIEALSIFKKSLPNESAICLYGMYRDTVIGDADLKMAVVDEIKPTKMSESSPTHIMYEDGIACKSDKRLIGIAHSHPLARWGCDHSVNDAVFMFSQGTKYWFSIVFCPRSVSILWSDGRRYVY